MTDEQQPPQDVRDGQSLHGAVGGAGEQDARDGRDVRVEHGGWGEREEKREEGSGQEEHGETKRGLARNRKHKVVGGVCGGLGRYFDLDPVIFRVPLAVLSVVGGLGLIFYGFAWLLIPAEGERENEARRLLSGRVEGASLSAILIALVGCGLFLASLGSRSTPFSLMLVGAVAGAAHWSRRRRQAEAAGAWGAPIDPTTAQAVADAPPETQAPPAPSLPSWWRDPVMYEGHGGVQFHYAPYRHHGSGYLWGPDNETPRTATDRAAFRKRLRRGQPSMGGLVFLLAVAAAVTGTAADWGARPLGASLTLGLACALAVFGLGLVISAFAGRVGGGTVFAVVLTGILLAGAAVTPREIGTDWDERQWTPASIGQVRPEYRLEGGIGELDLRRAGLKKDKTIRTSARVGAGQLKVVVPRDARVRLHAHVKAGQIRVPRGTGSEDRVTFDTVGGLNRKRTTTLDPFDGVPHKGTVDLKLEVGFGQAEVVRELSSGERSDGAAQEAVFDGGEPAGEAGHADRDGTHRREEAVR